MDYGTQAMVNPQQLDAVRRAIGTPGTNWQPIVDAFGGDYASMNRAINANSGADWQAPTGWAPPEIVERVKAGGAGLEGIDPQTIANARQQAGMFGPLADAMQQTGATVGRQMDGGAGMMPPAGSSAAALAGFANLPASDPGVMQPMLNPNWNTGGMPAGTSGAAAAAGPVAGGGLSGFPGSAPAAGGLNANAIAGGGGLSSLRPQIAMPVPDQYGGGTGLAVPQQSQWSQPMQSLYNQAGARKGFGPGIKASAGY